MKSFATPVLLLVFLFFSVSVFSQNKNPQFSISRKPGISAGALFSIQQERRGNKLPYSGKKIGRSESTAVFNNVIEGINFDEDAANNDGQYSIPPDPNGAAGMKQVVSIVNSSIEWHTKDGIKEASKGLKNFFSTLNPLTYTYDPKVIYDQYSDRFLVVALERTDIQDGSSSNTSRIFLAVSDNGDPNGTWYYQALNTKIAINGIDHWVDYPGFAVGANAIYVTGNMFTFQSDSSKFGGSRLWIIPKYDLYNGGASVAKMYNPSKLVGLSDIPMEPAHMFGTPPANTGTFLLTYSGFSDGTNEALSVIRVDSPLSSPKFNQQFVLFGNIDNTQSVLPDAPQKGTPVKISVNDRKVLKAVWRDNRIWAVSTVLPPSGPDAGQTTAHWFQIKTNALFSLLKGDDGDIGGEDISANAFTFFPSIAVNGNDDITVGFSASSSTIYAGAYYAGRKSNDPAGTIGRSFVLKEGLDYYVRKFNGSENRWGDFSGSSVDPADNKFWIFNEYAIFRGTIINNEDGRWGTAWAVYNLYAAPSVSVSVPNGGEEWTIGSAQSIIWNSENINFVKIEYSTDNGTSWHVIASREPANKGVFNWLVPDSPSGQCVVKISDADNNTISDLSNSAFSISPISDISERDGADIPREFSLSQNYPNPFNPTTTIQYSLPARTVVRIVLFNILGEPVKTLVNEVKNPGNYNYTFNAGNINSGVYFYKMYAGSFTYIRKLIYLK